MKHALNPFLVLVLVLAGAAPLGAEPVDVIIGLDFGRGAPEMAFLQGGGSPSSGVHEPAQTVMEFVVLPPLQPRAAEEARDEAADEEERAAAALVHLPSAIGGAVSYERISFWGQDGNVYGLSAGYQREIRRASLGGILTYKYHDMKVASLDVSSSRLTGIVYGKYTLLASPVELSAGANAQAGYAIMHGDGQDDYGVFGGGLFFSVGKDFGFLQATAGFSYSYAKMDLAIVQDFAHLLKFGAVVGVPIGQRLAVNLFVSDTLNVSDYDEKLDDNNYVTLGAEAGFQLTRSWGLSLGYKTVLGISEYSSHEVYLGTLWKF